MEGGTHRPTLSVVLVKPSVILSVVDLLLCGVTPSFTSAACQWVAGGKAGGGRTGGGVLAAGVHCVGVVVVVWW